MKKYEIRCPDCGGILAQANNSRELIGKTYTCDGPHDEVLNFISQLKDVSRVRKLHYDKLVRDRIPEIIKLDGCKCKYHIADDMEFGRMLHAKLLEEAKEFIQKPSAEELADILEVVDALRNHHNIELSEIKHQKIMKRTNRGSFKKKIILEITEDVQKYEKYRDD